MAYTVTKDTSVFGNKRVVICNVTADAASGIITPGLGVVDGYSLSPISMNSGAPLIKISGSTVVVSAATNGDNFYLVVYGK